MDEPHPRPGLLDLPQKLHMIISGLVDVKSRRSVANSSKRARHLWMHAVFRRVRFTGDQENLYQDLRCYLSDTSTLPVDRLRQSVKSLAIRLDRPGLFPRPDYVLEGLPGLIVEVLQFSRNIDVLELRIEHLNADQGTSLAESLPHPRDLPKVKHLKVAACSFVEPKIIHRCTALGGLISLQLGQASQAEAC